MKRKIKNAFILPKGRKRDFRGTTFVPDRSIGQALSAITGLPDNAYSPTAQRAAPVQRRISGATFQCCCRKTYSHGLPLLRQRHIVLLPIQDDIHLRLFLQNSTATKACQELNCPFFMLKYKSANRFLKCNSFFIPKFHPVLFRPCHNFHHFFVV